MNIRLMIVIFSTTKLKTPHRNIDLFGLLTFLIIISKCSLNVSTLDPGVLYTQLTMIFLFLFMRSSMVILTLLYFSRRHQF